MRNQSRRDFLKATGVAGAGLLAVAPAMASSATNTVNNDEVGMLYDATMCVGCKACMSACKRANNDNGNLVCEKAPFDKDTLWDAPLDLSGNNRTIIKLYKEEDKPWSYVKHSCMHCQKASCVSVCPVAALTKDPETGIVKYNKNICIGCRYCQVACPFNIPKFQWDRKAPQIVKCNMCIGTYLKEHGITACAAVCPTGAIVYGQRKELLKEAKSRLRDNPDRYIQKIYGETEVGGINHLYLSAVPFSKLGLPDLPDAAPAVFSENIHHTIYKGFIAPIALYTSLCIVALLNLRKQSKHNTAQAPAHDGGKH